MAFSTLSIVSEAEQTWYEDVVRVLHAERIPFLIGGAFALWKYTGVRRPTKDLDLFMRPRDLSRSLKVLETAGCRTEITARHWLGKAFYKDFLVDIIVGLANAVGQVDDSWFEQATRATIFGMNLPLVGPEDMIWGKAFVMERDRYDGADIAHMLLVKAGILNWRSLLKRFVSHEPVLLSHLLLFSYIYPHAKKSIPEWVLRHLHTLTLKPTLARSRQRICRGTLFSRTQYKADVEQHGFRDPRLLPDGPLTAQQILE